MTPAQMLTLKNDILVTNIAALQAFVDAVDDQAIAEWYNVEAAPVFWVWRTKVTKAEIVQEVSRTGTSFTWQGNGFTTRTFGELKAWDELFSSGYCNPSLPNVRQAFGDIFNGTGNAALNVAHLGIVSRREASRIERLFATGAGSDTNANAGIMKFERLLDYLTVARAWRDVGV